MSAERRYVIVDASARRAVPQNRPKKIYSSKFEKKTQVWSLEFLVLSLAVPTPTKVTTILVCLNRVDTAV
jgi:hypothetical protein